MGAGEIAIVSIALAIASMIVLFVLGYRAVTAIPTAENLRPDLEPKRIMRAGLLVIVIVVGWIVGIIAGIVWIVQMFTGGA